MRVSDIDVAAAVARATIGVAAVRDDTFATVRTLVSDGRAPVIVAVRVD